MGLVILALVVVIMVRLTENYRKLAKYCDNLKKQHEWEYIEGMGHVCSKCGKVATF